MLTCRNRSVVAISLESNRGKLTRTPRKCRDTDLDYPPGVAITSFFCDSAILQIVSVDRLCEADTLEDRERSKSEPGWRCQVALGKPLAMGLGSVPQTLGADREGYSDLHSLRLNLIWNIV
jgi:hypothetical protein